MIKSMAKDQDTAIVILVHHKVLPAIMSSSYSWHSYYDTGGSLVLRPAANCMEPCSSFQCCKSACCYSHRWHAGEGCSLANLPATLQQYLSASEAISFPAITLEGFALQPGKASLTEVDTARPLMRQYFCSLFKAVEHTPQHGAGCLAVETDFIDVGLTYHRRPTQCYFQAVQASCILEISYLGSG